MTGSEEPTREKGGERPTVLVADPDMGVEIELRFREPTPDLEAVVADVLAAILIAEFGPVVEATVESPRGTNRETDTT